MSPKISEDSGRRSPYAPPEKGAGRLEAGSKSRSNEPANPGRPQEPETGKGVRREATRWAWVPIALLVAAIVTARVAGLHQPHPAETLRLLLSFTFYTLASLGALFLIARNFLKTGLPGLLLLECGVVLWSLAGTVGDAVSRGDANVDVTIFNTLILLSGLCHLAGVILSRGPQRALRATWVWLGTCWALALGAVWFVTWATLEHRLPIFFIPGEGGTLVRQCVLVSAIATFALSAVLLPAGGHAAGAPFSRWYAQALLLLAAGLFGIMMQLSLWSVVNWLARTAQWLSGLYLLLAAMAALRESNLPLLPQVREPNARRYGTMMAVVIVLAGAALRLAFLPMLGTRAVFVTFYPAVTLAALYGGWRAGLLATVLSALVTEYFWLGPVGFAIADSGDVVALALFLLGCAIICAVTEAMHRAQIRTAKAQAEVQVALERQRGAEVLRESEELFRLMFTESSVGKAQADPATGRFVKVNAALCRMTGYSEAELLERSFHDITHPEEQAEDRERFRKLVSGESKVYTCEKRYVRADGGVVWAEVTVNLVRDAAGQPMRSFALIQDVTARKRAEARLQADLTALTRMHELSGRLLDATGLQPLLQETMDAAVGVVGAAKGTLQLLEGDALRIVAHHGHTQTFLDYFASAENVASVCGAATRQGQRVVVEDVERSDLFAGTASLPVLRAAGVRAVQSTPLRTRAGQLLGILTTQWSAPHVPDKHDLWRLDLLVRQASDLIEHKRAEDALRESADRLKLLSEVAGRLLAAEDPQRIVNELCRDVMRELDCDVFFNFLADKQSGRLHLNACAGIPDEEAAKIEWLDYGVAVCGCVAQQGCRIVAEDIGQTPDPRTDLVRSYGVRAYACHPLLDGTRVMGTLSFGAKDRPRFTANELALMKAVADHVAVAMQRKQSQEVLRKSEERLRLALGAAGAAAWETNLVTGQNIWDERMAGLLRVPPDQAAAQQRWLEFVHPDDRVRVVAAFTAASGSGAPPLKEEFRVHCADGSERWFLSHGIQAAEPNAARRMLGIVQDITERKQTEHELERTRAALQQHALNLENLVQERTAKLQETVAELEHFSYTITHDMRAPLRAMQGFSQIISKEHARHLDDTGRDFLRRITEASRRMDHLITDALNYSKVVEGEFALERVEPKPLLAGMIESYPQFQPPHAQIELVGDFSRVLATPAGLTQVFSNLLGNAVKFVEAGKTPKVRVWAEQVQGPESNVQSGQPDRAKVRIWFEDNGIGIPEDQQNRIFDLFQRLSKDYEGTGVGLALVRKVVARMQGKVGFESKLGEGSRFWIELAKA